MIEEWDLASINLDRIKKHTYEVAVLPTSAIEPHNFHLPYGQDFFQAYHISRRCCKEAWQRSQKVVCLPGLPYGVDSNLFDFPLAMHVSQHTLDLMITDIVKTLNHYDINKMVILNAHGGNDFVPLIREIQGTSDSHLFCVNFWQCAPDKYGEIFEEAEDHAGEMETSIALHCFPELVEFEKAGDGNARPFRFKALEKGWAKTSRRFGRLNNQCATKNPAKATQEKGEQFLDLVCGRITDFLVELAETPIDAHFPHQP